MGDNISLTPEEQRRFLPLFKEYDLDDSSIVLGERIRPLLQKSGLSPQMLAQIWQIVDVENRGFLEYGAFAKCLRLIAHAQQGSGVSPRLANVPSAMPNFDQQAPTAPAPANQAAQPTGLSSPTSPPVPEHRIPVLTSENKRRFGELFDRSVKPNAAFIEGTAAKDIFSKANLGTDLETQIWNLVDVDRRNQLTKNEFVLAMHLIQSLMEKSLTSLPATLPSVWSPWVGSSTTKSQQPIATGTGGAQAAFSPSNTSAHAPLNAPQATGSSVASVKLSNLGITDEDRNRYYGIFDDLDTKKQGIIGPSEAVPVLTRSKLPEDVLAAIWDLADTQSRGQLDKDDFARAMHFLRLKLNGKPLPNETGGKQVASPSGVSSPNAIKPMSPNSTNNSLNDLVSLDKAVFKPMNPEKANAKHLEPVPENKFVPTSTFGQQLLKNSTGRNKSNSISSIDGLSSPQSPPVQPAKLVGQPTPQQQPAAPQSAQATGSSATGAEFNHQSQELDSLQQKVVENKADMARVNEDLASVLKQKSDLETKVAELRKVYDSGAKQVHDTQKAVEKVKQDISALEKDIALRTSGLEAIKSKQIEESKKLEEFNQKKVDLETETGRLTAEISNLEATVSAMEQETRTHQTSITENETQVQLLRDQVGSMQKRRSALESEIIMHRERSEQAIKTAAEQEKRAQEERAALELAQTNVAKAAQDADIAVSKATSSSVVEPSSKSIAEEANQSNISKIPSIPNIPDGVTIPSFKLPMDERHSITSSVANNAPLSVKDFSEGSDVEKQSNFSDSKRDSVVFQDASEGQVGFEDSSDDDEGPQPAIPNKYTPTDPVDRQVSATPAAQTILTTTDNGDTEPLTADKTDNSLYADPVVAEKPDVIANSGAAPALSAAATSGSITANNDTDISTSAPQEAVKTSEPAVPETPKTERVNAEFTTPQNLNNEGPVAVPLTASDMTSPVTSKHPVIPLGRSPVSQPKFASDMHPKTEAVETVEASAPAAPAATATATTEVDQAAFPPSNTSAPETGDFDEFDEFDDLQEAKEDDSDANANTTQASVPDEWSQLFASAPASNQTQQPPSSSQFPPQQPQSAQQPVPQQNAKVLELTNMGFTTQDAEDALAKNNNDLLAATNFLLDRS